MKKGSFIGFLNLPKGTTRKLYLKNMLALTGLFVLALAALTVHIVSHSMWIRNYMSKGYDLDVAQAEAAMGREDVQPSELGAIDSKLMVVNMRLPSMVEQGDVYFQDGKDYRFALPIDSLTETGIYYDDTYTAYFGVTDTAQWLAELEALPPIEYEASEGAMAEYYIMPMSRLVRVTSGDAEVLALVSYDAQLAAGDTLRGIFTRWNQPREAGEYTLGSLAFTEYYMTDYAHSLYLSGQSGDSVMGWLFEAQDVPVEFEDEDWGYMVFYAIITGIVLLIVLLFFVKPTFHPFFRQMQRYGNYDEVTASIDQEFAQGKKFMENRKMMLSDSWHIKKSTFMNIINRNPDQIPENQKLREGSVNKRRYSDTTEKPPVLDQKGDYDPLKQNMKNRYNKYY